MFKPATVILIIGAGFLGLYSSSIAQIKAQVKGHMNQPSISSKSQQAIALSTKFEFHPLPYSYDALEPYIDRLTVQIHYNKHHRAYYDNLMRKESWSMNRLVTI